MNTQYSKPNNGIDCDESEYKTNCAGRGCENVQTEYVNIAVKIKSGWLCPSCIKALEEEGFVFYRTVVNRGRGEGKICQSYIKLKEDGKSEDATGGRKSHVL